METCRRSRGTGILALAVALSLGGGHVAWGTTLVPMHDADLVRTSALIVVGTVRRIETLAVRDGRILTEVTLNVDRRVKGRLRGGKVVVTAPGGRVGDRLAYVFGAPEFTRGERVLVFLKRTAEGRLRTNALALGKYHLEAARDGRARARRTVPTSDLRHLDRFLARLDRLAAGQVAELVPSGRVHTTAGAVVGRAVVDRFTYLTGSPYRWFDDPVALRVANADSGLGQASTDGAVASAMAAWNNVPTATLVVETGPATTPAHSIAGGSCDGISAIQFDDPYSEVQDFTNCAGVLGVGGFCSSGATMVVNGTTFHRIIEGDVTMNNGLGACWGATNTAEVLTHEIGHVIGLGHSADANATMYAYAHFDGRGAFVDTDDVAGVSTLYPVVAGTTTSTSTSTTTSTSTSLTTSSTSSTSSSSTTSSSTSTSHTTSSTTSTLPQVSTTSSTSSSTTSSTSSTNSSASTTSSTSTTTTSTTSISSSSSTAPATSTSTTSSSSSTSSTGPPPSSTTTTLPPADPRRVETDADGDGVPDAVDACPDTPARDLVDDQGCSVCPCNTTRSGAPWGSRIAYLRCVKGETRHRVFAGTLGRGEARNTVRAAVFSTCGRDGLTRCCVYRSADVTHVHRGQCRIVTAVACDARASTGLGTDAATGSCLPNPCD